MMYYWKQTYLEKKTIEKILNGTHYVRSLRGFIIIGETIERLKWKAFFEQYGNEKTMISVKLKESC